MPKVKPLDPRIASAIERAGNPGFRVTAEGFGQLERDGQVIRVGVDKEEIQLEMVLDCDVHRRCCTVHAVGEPEDFMCPYCNSDEQLVAAGKRRPSSYEREFHSGLTDLGLGERLRAEEVVGGWSGRVDFVDRVSGAGFQVDGEGHMQKRLFGVPVSGQLEKDVEMCMQAMKEGRVLVRVHYRDVQNGSGVHLAAEIMRQAAIGLAGPVLVLSSCFNLSDPTNSNTVPRQLGLLYALIKALRAKRIPFSMYSDACKQIWIKPCPPL